MCDAPFTGFSQNGHTAHIFFIFNVYINIFSFIIFHKIVEVKQLKVSGGGGGGGGETHCEKCFL